jgi:hypothetical protein
VHTVTETVPALEVRSELVDATFLFARNPERDRVAALVTVDQRGATTRGEVFTPWRYRPAWAASVVGPFTP